MVPTNQNLISMFRKEVGENNNLKSRFDWLDQPFLKKKIFTQAYNKLRKPYILVQYYK